MIVILDESMKSVLVCCFVAFGAIWICLVGFCLFREGLMFMLYMLWCVQQKWRWLVDWRKMRKMNE